MKKYLIALLIILTVFIVSCKKTPKQIEVTEIIPSSENLEVYIDEVVDFSYALYPEDANHYDIFMMTTSPEMIYLNDLGIIKGLKKGECTVYITNTYNDVSAKINVTVKDHADDPHYHTFSNVYSSDLEYHWHQATCEHTAEVADKAPHTFEQVSKGLVENDTKYKVVEKCKLCLSEVSHFETLDGKVIKEDELKVFAIEQKGQYGDGTLFKYGDIEILIDGGTRDTNTELKRLIEEQVTDHKIEMVISSHAHDDHYGAFNSSNKNTLYDAGVTKVDYIIDSGADNYGASYSSIWIASFREFYRAKGSIYYPIQKLVEGHHDDAGIKLADDLEIQFFDTGKYCVLGEKGSGNPNSIALAVRWNEYNYFCFGDLPSGSEAGILNYSDNILFKNGTVNVFKACHHGSNGSNTDALLKKLHPNYSYICSAITSSNQGASGVVSNQHPYVDARNRIMNAVGKDNVYWTGTMGTFVMICKDGTITFKGNGRTVPYYYANNLVDPNEEKDLPLSKTKWYLSGH